MENEIFEDLHSLWIFIGHIKWGRNGVVIDFDYLAVEFAISQYLETQLWVRKFDAVYVPRILGWNQKLAVHIDQAIMWYILLFQVADAFCILSLVNLIDFFWQRICTIHGGIRYNLSGYWVLLCCFPVVHAHVCIRQPLFLLMIIMIKITSDIVKK